MTAFFGILAITLSSCESTYKRTTLDNDMKTLAKKEYKLDVEVKDIGETVGVRLQVKNFLGEMMASDQMVWNQIDNLMEAMSRVALSLDHPPKFIVMDVVDADNNDIHILFTRATVDLQKVMAEGESRTQYQDRLLTELQIGTMKRPLKMDPVWIMMMASEVSSEDQIVHKPFEIEEVQAPIFYAKVAANTIRRLIEERQTKDNSFLLRDVEGVFLTGAAPLGSFHIQLDLISSPKNPVPINNVLLDLLSLSVKEVGTLLRGYRFENFSQISVVERNSGKIITVPRG